MELLEQHFRKNKRKLINFLNKPLNGDVNLAEDIVQEAFSRALMYYETFSGDEEKFPAWFNKVLFNVYCDTTRKIKKEEVESIGRHLYIEDIDYCALIEQRESIRKVINSIDNERDKTVLTYFYLYGYSYLDIEGMTGVKENSARQICYRFRVSLKDKWKIGL